MPSLKLFKEKNIFLAVVVAIIINNIYFIYFDDRGLNMYEYRSFNQTILASKEGSISNNLGSVLTSSFRTAWQRHEYPPLIPTLYGTLWNYTSNDRFIGLLIDQLFLVLLTFSVYKIGKNLKSEKCAMISAILVLGLPTIISTSRQLALEIPLIASVAFSLSFVLKAYREIKFLDIFYFGLSIVFCSLIKQTFILYFFGPIAILIFFLANDLRHKEIMMLLALFGISIVILMNSVHFNEFEEVKEPIFQFILGHQIQKFVFLPPYIIQNFFYISLGPIYFFLFVFSIIKAVSHFNRKKASIMSYLLSKDNYQYITLAAWVLTAFLLVPFFFAIAVVQGFDLYHSYSGLSAICIICGYFLTSVKNKALQRGLLLIVLINCAYINSYKILYSSQDIKEYKNSNSFLFRNDSLGKNLCLLDIKCLKPGDLFIQDTQHNTYEINKVGYFSLVKQKVRNPGVALTRIYGSSQKKVSYLNWDDDYYEGDLLISLELMQKLNKIDIQYLNFKVPYYITDFCDVSGSNSSVIVFLGKNISDHFDVPPQNSTFLINLSMIYYSYVGDAFHLEIYNATCLPKEKNNLLLP